MKLSIEEGGGCLAGRGVHSDFFVVSLLWSSVAITK